MIAFKNNKSAHQILSTLQNISCSLSIVVTISYWSFIGKPQHFIASFHKHGVSMVLGVIDLFLSANAIPIKRAALELTIVCIIYGVTTFTLTKAFGIIVYEQLDWNSAPLSSAGFMAKNLVLLAMVLCALYGIKRCILARCIKENEISVKIENKSKTIPEVQVQKQPVDV